MAPFHGGSDCDNASILSGSTVDLGRRAPAIARYLYQKGVQSGWLEAADEESEVSEHGVIIRNQEGAYIAEPQNLDSRLISTLENIDLKVAMTLSSRQVRKFIGRLSPLESDVVISGAGVSIPVFKSFADFGPEQYELCRDTYMCVFRREHCVLLWTNTVSSMLRHAAYVQRILSEYLPDSATPTSRSIANSRLPSRAPSFTLDRSSGMGIPKAPVIRRDSSSMSDTKMGSFVNEKTLAIQTAIEKEEAGQDAFDPEKDGYEVPKRKMLLTHAFIIGFSIALVVVVEMACIAKLIQETRYDGKYIRFALIATIPVFALFALFFMIVIMGSLFQLFGPLSGCSGNSMFYSGKAPKPGRHVGYELPHITVQMPVYKEGLKGVIIPSVTSVQAAIRYYQARGGTASIFVNEDGMQTVGSEIAEARRAFYDMHNIGWCARPKQCTEEGEKYFLRKGQFKKASNMNYCLDFSLRVEDETIRLIEATCQARGCIRDDLTADDEYKLYEEARESIIERDGGKTWAGGDVRIGEIILIIDSDTRVPEDCLLYGALEMHESPEVALIQHSSGILKVVNNAFENGISYFTNLVYTSIQFAVGNGDSAPFVGHNTFIRWKALQSIAFREDDTTKFWSDSHVSEDFDVSLRLQMNGFIIRLATYHKDGFKEGVSLTVYDELARWEKYAYGCNELVFNPLIKWPTRGPITRLFWRFLFSNIKVTSKITIIAYIFTYYAIASAVPLTLANYLIYGWFSDIVDQFYLTSWKIFVGMAVVFNLLSPLAYAMLRHRLGQKKFFWSILEAAKWTPMFLLFFGGLSFHLLKAIICHFFSIKMEWTATAKELEQSGFRVGLDRVLKDFKWMYLLFIFPATGGMIYLAQFAPYGWKISDFSAIVPIANQVGCHALLPFALGLF